MIGGCPTFFLVPLRLLEFVEMSSKFVLDTHFCGFGFSKDHATIYALYSYIKACTGPVGSDSRNGAEGSCGHGIDLGWD